MQILGQEKDEIISKLESDIKTLETKNLELKYTNRNLISTVSEQKDKLKTLQSQINNLKSSKAIVGKKDLDKISKEHTLLLEKYEKLKLQYSKSLEEINELKKLVPESKTNKSLFGRFLNRSDKDDQSEDIDKSPPESKKTNSEKKN
jgi:predicted RNase H-like nuclease (RuvC/YqgF family)